MTFNVREEAFGIGQPDLVAKYGVGESVGRSRKILEDDYGIAVKVENFVAITTGVDPSKFAGKSGRIDEEVMQHGNGKPVVDSGGLRPGELVSKYSKGQCFCTYQDSHSKEN